MWAFKVSAPSVHASAAVLASPLPNTGKKGDFEEDKKIAVGYTDDCKYIFIVISIKSQKKHGNLSKEESVHDTVYSQNWPNCAARLPTVYCPLPSEVSLRNRLLTL